MGYYVHDVYSSPEVFGLEIVFAVDTGEQCEFDMVIVWRDDAGRFYFATDAGCSCPSPFEWATGLEDLTPLRDRATVMSVLAGMRNSTPQDMDRLRTALTDAGF